MQRMHAVIWASALLLAAPAAAEEYSQVSAVADPASAPVAAPPPPAAPAPTPALKSGRSTDEGWNGQWGLLFQLNNVFTNASILDDFEGKIGGVYYLDRETAIRAGFGMRRGTNPAVVTKHVTESGPEKDETYTVNVPGSGLTSESNVNVSADYLKRLMPTAVAPYAGAGLSLDWRRTTTNYKDEVTVVDQVETYDNSDWNTAVGVRGIVGAEWRLHSNFALFAEYNLGISILEYVTRDHSYMVQNTLPDGQTVARRDTDASSSPKWFGAGTGLSHGAQFGLSVQF